MPKPNINFYEETIKILNKHGKTENDIRWVGTDEFYIPLEKLRIMFDFEYNNGFGRVNIPQSLVVVGDNWWLERHEYDGAEWWEYKILPTKPKNIDNRDNAIKEWIYDFE